MCHSFFSTDHFFASEMQSFSNVWNFPSFEFSVRNAALACMLVGGRWTEPKSPTYIRAEKRSFKITFAFKVDTEKNIKRSYSLNKSTLFTTESLKWRSLHGRIQGELINYQHKESNSFSKEAKWVRFGILDKSKALRHFPLSRKPHHISGLSFFPPSTVNKQSLPGPLFECNAYAVLENNNAAH